MSRDLITKELVDTQLASGHGGWIYCGACGENIGNLCYVTYDSFCFSYKCKCGNHGKMRLVFEPEAEASAVKSDKLPVIIKNRLCCCEDNSPLFTILYKKLQSYKYSVVCTKCGKIYQEERTL